MLELALLVLAADEDLRLLDSTVARSALLVLAMLHALSDMEKSRETKHVESWTMGNVPVAS